MNSADDMGSGHMIYYQVPLQLVQACNSKVIAAIFSETVKLILLR
jgi:hypothetical protein